ncbi:hypothetical protein T439DRAFT_322136 [Meredithblackwellia eburnea MCA 4105]
MSERTTDDSTASSTPDGSTNPSSKAKGKEKEKDKSTVARVDHACVACRKNKVRCSGAQPCVRCSRLNLIPCVYDLPKLGPPKTYVESLKRKIEAMENVLRNISVNAGMDDLSSVLDSIENEGAKTEALEQAVELLNKRRQLESTFNSLNDSGLMDEQGFPLRFNTHPLEVNFMHDRFAGPASGAVFTDTILQEVLPNDFLRTIEDLQVMSLAENMLTKMAFSYLKTAPLPPADLAAALIQAYFEHVNPLFPIIHRPSFERGIKSGLSEMNPSFRRLLFSVFALGARFTEDSRLAVPETSNVDPNLEYCKSQAKGYNFFQVAASEASSHWVAPAAIYDIQGAVLGTLWCVGAMTPVVCWHWVGLVLRQAVEVGVHSEHRHRWKVSPLQDQLRKRAFFTLSALDHRLSVLTGRPLALQDHDSDLQYPIDVTDEALDDWELRGSDSSPPPPPLKPTAVASWLCVIKMLKITSVVSRHLYGMQRLNERAEVQGIVSKLDSMLNQWLETVPEHLRWDAEKVETQYLPVSAFLYCTFYNAQILVHRDFFLEKSPHNPFPSGAICVNAARATARILDTCSTRGVLPTCYVFACEYAAVSAAVLTILLIQQGPQALRDATSSSAIDIRRCMGVILQLAPISYMGSDLENKARHSLSARLTRHLFDLTALPVSVKAPTIDDSGNPASNLHESFDPLTAVNFFANIDRSFAATSGKATPSSSPTPSGLTPESIPDVKDFNSFLMLPGAYASDNLEYAPMEAEKFLSDDEFEKLLRSLQADSSLAAGPIL